MEASVILYLSSGRATFLWGGGYWNIYPEMVIKVVKAYKTDKYINGLTLVYFFHLTVILDMQKKTHAGHLMYKELKVSLQ